MERQRLFNEIEERLHFLAYRIKGRARLNLLDLNIHSENFFASLVNQIYGWKLQNANEIQSNNPGFDLVDDANNLYVQVSNTATKEKIQKSINSCSSNYASCIQFKFLLIGNEGPRLRRLKYEIPNSIIFDSLKDILDIASVLVMVDKLSISCLQSVNSFVKSEIKLSETSPISTHIAKLIQILSESYQIDEVPSIPEKNDFDIEEKISFNELAISEDTIHQFAIETSRLSKIYSQSDEFGKNKSMYVLSMLHGLYSRFSLQRLTADQVFLNVIQQAKETVKESKNYEPIEDDELDTYIQIIVVDAFMRCKIFKNPKKCKGEENVSTR